MSRSETVTLTNMCMICHENKVLVQDRKDPDWPGITFPGGHVEKGESFTDAVIREVYEETGLKIKAPQLCGIKDWPEKDGSRYMVLFYKTSQFEGSLVSSEEGEVYWVELARLEQLPLAHGMDKMLKVFLNDQISEHYFHVEDGKWMDELK
ncbi:MAG: 8-oxo-dGTP diphosphatase [Clostridiales bacterium]|nr:8-oxo-dGTP diphosphatase [Clostridiales bacterium]